MMNGLWILLTLISIAAFPVLLMFLWLRYRRFPMTLPWFLLSLVCGAVSLGIAAVGQGIFPQPEKNTLWTLLVKIFVQIAFIEEAGRLMVLLLFFSLGRRFGKSGASYTPAFGAATGLLSGLGFAVIETASYGAANVNIALVRAFTAAPLHGACGSRVGLAALETGRGFRFLIRFFSAVIIHGAYNFLLVSPGIPSVLPIIIAFAALLASIRIIRSEDFAPS
jgi:RsiW-degrading membrane proteinase PrsW (M82 family)